MLKKYITQNIYIILLLLLCGVLFVTNYVPGTYLLGWDNLSTELNPMLGLKRALWSVWEESQSFGSLAGLAHSADFLHSLLMLVLSFVLPQNMLRYTFHIFALFMGGWGLFKLLSYKHVSTSSKLLPFVGAVFYMLNPGTVQIFALPHEAFSIFFASLPWLVLVFLNNLHSKKLLDKKAIVYLLIANLLATPMSFIQTLFLVYLIVLGSFSLGVLLEHHFNRFFLKKILLSFSLILLVNMFWILPQVYFLGTSYNVVGNSKINQLATETVFNRNREKGTLENFSRMEGFFFDAVATKGDLLFLPWKEHFSNSIINYLRYLPFVFIMIGLFKSKRDHWGFCIVFFICCIALLNNELLFSAFNDLLRKSSFLNQIFRSPFTKFILVYSFVGSYLLVNGLESFINIFHKYKKTISYLIPVLFLFVIIALNVPAFTGNFFATAMKVIVPSYYFDVITYFKDVDKNKRIALLPDPTYWGWFKNDWGYDGSGFLWYGIEQPIVARAFDVWSATSESYYWEVKDTIEDQDIVGFERVLSKYDIQYLIVDNTLTPVSGQEFGLQYDQLANILSNSTKVELVGIFGRLRIYKYINTTSKDFVSVLNNPKSVGPEIRITDRDIAYRDVGNYYTTAQMPSYFYPFANFTTVTQLVDKRWEISETNDQLILSAFLGGINSGDYDLLLPQEDSLEKFKILNDGFLTEVLLPISTKIFANRIYVYIDKYLVENTDSLKAEVRSCGANKDQDEWATYFNSIYLKSSDRGKLCLGYDFTLLPHWNGYLVRFEVDNINGITPFMYIVGNKSRGQSKAELNMEDGVSYAVLNPGYKFDDGYTISFQNISYKGVVSENKIFSSQVYLLPFDYVKNIKLKRKDILEREELSIVTNYTVLKKNYYTYAVKVPSSSIRDTVVLNQAYDIGWVAICDRELCKARHIKVNNWANGWVFEGNVPEGDILIIFWPQYLEYLGLILITVPFIWTSRVLSHHRAPKHADEADNGEV